MSMRRRVEGVEGSGVIEREVSWERKLEIGEGNVTMEISTGEWKREQE